MIFERLGEEKFYPNVNAPAVALRMNLDEYENNVKQAYKGYAPQNSLYSYFYEWSLTSTRNECSMITSSHFVPMNDNLLDYFIANNESVSQNLAESDLFQWIPDLFQHRKAEMLSIKILKSPNRLFKIS